MNYKLSTKNPNQIVEIERWVLLDKFVTITKKWRTGHLILTEFPVFPEHYSPSVGIDVNHEFEPLHHSFKGSETRYEYLHVNQNEQELIEKIYSDSMGEGLEQLGWKNTKFQCWFYGELKVDEIN